ncbi:hypothetical protein FOA52_011356 [Chlamydomonas sp. UWO 241]|nr:hypothetical protein FOA52_011356 [Chlamydomonas sp. UWO 241]
MGGTTPPPPPPASAVSNGTPNYGAPASVSPSGNPGGGEAPGLAELKSQVDRLTTLVHQQQHLLEAGVREVRKMKTEAPTTHRGPSKTNLEVHPLARSPWSLQPGVQPDAQATASGAWRPAATSPFDSQRIGIGDRRLLGLYDSRFHSTSAGATPKDFRVLPDRIILVRHAESAGNVDDEAYTYIPDSQIPLTARGHMQARAAGQKIREYIEARSGRDYRLFCYLSPYKRSLQTYESMSCAFPSDNIMGVQEEVQLREQDFGNFQDVMSKSHEKAERVRFGRFYYRFPNGESGADVYDRITIFEDHMVRDINAGRFAHKTNLVIVSHGLALRVFLMRWFHWTLAQYLMVHNPPNAEPLILERVISEAESRPNGPVAWMHTKALYQLAPESLAMLRGCTAEMCSTGIMPRTSEIGSSRVLPHPFSG